MVEGIIDSIDLSLSKLWEIVKDKEACVLLSMGLQESDTTERLNHHQHLSSYRIHSSLKK